MAESVPWRYLPSGENSGSTIIRLWAGNRFSFLSAALCGATGVSKFMAAVQPYFMLIEATAWYQMIDRGRYEGTRERRKTQLPSVLILSHPGVQRNAERIG